MPAQRILIVEDEPDGADLVRRLLKSKGKEAAVAANAEVAIAALEADPGVYAAIVIDLALPEMDGFELMTLLRGSEYFAQMPLIAITAFHTPELKVRALESGFDAYFPKPLDTAAFAASIDRFLN
ncbi:MAG: response regulator [Anaerolineae bacterium]|nr:response regulator [Anaerolineae bacterium]NUQ06650.1 response regulator [Anaerolineae bacterium]